MTTENSSETSTVQSLLTTDDAISLSELSRRRQRWSQLLDQHIQRYRQLLCSRSILQELAIEHKYFAAYMIIRHLASARHCDSFGSDNWREHQRKIHQYALQIVREMQYAGADIDGLAQKLRLVEDEIRNEYTELDPVTRKDDEQFDEDDEDNIATIEAIASVGHTTRYFQYSDMLERENREKEKSPQQTDKPSPAIRQMCLLTDELVAMAALLAEQPAPSTNADDHMSEALRTTYNVYVKTGLASEFDKLLEIARSYRYMAYQQGLGYVPPLPPLKSATTQQQDAGTTAEQTVHLRRDARISGQYVGTEKGLMNIANTLITENELDKLAQIERYIISPYTRAWVDACMVSQGKDPTGHHQRLATSYHITEADAPFARHQLINDLNTVRLQFDKQVFDAYVEYVTRQVHTVKPHDRDFEWNIRKVLDALYQHPEGKKLVRKLVWERLWIVDQQRGSRSLGETGIDAHVLFIRHVLADDNYQELVLLGHWLRRHFQADPDAGAAKLYLEWVDFDETMFDYVNQHITTSGAPQVFKADVKMYGMNLGKLLGWASNLQILETHLIGVHYNILRHTNQAATSDETADAS